MFEKEALEYRKRARFLKSSEELIKFVSTDIYNRIGFVKKYFTKSFLRVYEVTVTQNLVYEILKFEIETGQKLVDFYEAKNENENGADLLLGLQVGTGYLKIPMQAKILNPHVKERNGTYNAFHHKNKKGMQINLLIDYAQRCGSRLPLYLLYNYTFGSPDIAAGETEHLYGCSYLCAEKIPAPILAKNTINFSDFHPSPGKPWYHLFRKRKGGNDGNDPADGPELNDPNSDIKEFYNRFGMDVTDEFISTLTFYTHEDLTAETDQWEHVTIDNFNDKVKSPRIKKPFYKMVMQPLPMRPDGREGTPQYIDDSPGELRVDEDLLEQWINEVQTEEVEIEEEMREGVY